MYGMISDRDISKTLSILILIPPERITPHHVLFSSKTKRDITYWQKEGKKGVDGGRGRDGVILYVSLYLSYKFFEAVVET